MNGNSPVTENPETGTKLLEAVRTELPEIGSGKSKLQAEKAEKPAKDKPKFDLDIKDGELVATEVEEEAKEVLEENLPADQSFADDDDNKGGEE